MRDIDLWDKQQMGNVRQQRLVSVNGDYFARMIRGRWHSARRNGSCGLNDAPSGTPSEKNTPKNKWLEWYKIGMRTLDIPEESMVFRLLLRHWWARQCVENVRFHPWDHELWANDPLWVQNRSKKINECETKINISIDIGENHPLFSLLIRMTYSLGNWLT